MNKKFIVYFVIAILLLASSVGIIHKTLFVGNPSEIQKFIDARKKDIKFLIDDCKDSWEFVKTNKVVQIIIAIALLIFSSVCFSTAFEKTSPKEENQYHKSLDNKY